MKNFISSSFTASATIKKPEQRLSSLWSNYYGSLRQACAGFGAQLL